MEPRIQYCTTSDGVRIAYYALGEGDPLIVFAPAAWSHLALEWELPALREWYEYLASQRLLVRWDWRGQGMSQREVYDGSPETMVRDLEAVVNHLNLDRVDLASSSGTTLGSISYAAHNPERVTRLAILSGFLRPRDQFRNREQFDALMSLAERDWELATETIAHALVGWSRSHSHESHRWAAFVK